MDVDKKKLRELLSQVAQRESLSAISKDMGIENPEALYAFVKKGYLGKSRRTALQKWLAAHGYLDDVKKTQIIVNSDDDNAFEEICLEMEALIVLLRSRRYEFGHKVTKFTAFISFYNSQLNKILQMISGRKD